MFIVSDSREHPTCNLGRKYRRREIEMALLDGACREVLDNTEFVAMVTAGPEGPHITATWGDYVRKLGFEDDRLLIPAGYYHHMETNLEHNPEIQLLVASRAVEGKLGPGQGFTLKGTGKLVDSGEAMDRVKSQFPWARAALVVDVVEAVSHL
jgi:Pyridoxamine 5'-phosphate oxidase